MLEELLRGQKEALGSGLAIAHFIGWGKVYLLDMTSREESQRFWNLNYGGIPKNVGLH